MTWPTAKLDELCAKIGSGATPRGGNKSYKRSGVALVRSMNVHMGTFKPDDLAFIGDGQAAKLNNVVLEADDVLLNITGASVARSCTLDNSILPARVNQHVCILRPEPTKLNYQYLMRFLTSAQTQQKLLRIAGAGATREAITKTELQKFQIPLPPLAEQKRIAGILDAADALRAKRRESLAQLDTLLQSTFLDMFGDPVTNPMEWDKGYLSDIVERLDGGKNVAQSETETDFRVLKVSAVTSGEYRPEESKYLPRDFEVPKSYLVRQGDLLISRANTVELIGATAYVWETPDNIALPDKIWKFIWKKDAEIEPLFIYHLSQDAEFRRVLGSRASGTSGSMKNIAKPKLLGLSIPLPPVDLQRQFAAIVESVEQQKASQRAHLAELDALFASLQSRAFRGDL